MNLTPNSVAALNEVTQRTGFNKTETINRALQLYNHFEEIQHNGGALYVRDTPDATGLTRVRIF